MRYAWDRNKSRANRSKHGVSFEIATRVFDDPYALSVQDRVVDGEERWQTIGLIEGVLVLLVAHTVSGDEPAGGGEETIRIISARKATSRERKAYEQKRQGRTD